MPYWRLFYHFVWGTKGREPLIDSELRDPIHRAIAAKVSDLGGIAHAVGGTEDHVHLVASLPPKIALSTFIGQVKGAGSHLVNHKLRPAGGFAWQDEYGVLSLGERSLSRVVSYVLDQARHHAQNTAWAALERVLEEEPTEPEPALVKPNPDGEVLL